MKLPADITLLGRKFHRVGHAKKQRAFDICFDPGSETDQNWMTEVGRLAHCIMPKIDSDVIIVQVRGGM